MNSDKMKRRIDEVMKTDATVASEPDFMITHMPFRKLANYKKSDYNTSGQQLLKEEDYNDEYRFDEDKLFKDFVEDVDRHEFYMVIGRNGSGKSHLIRWMYYQLLKFNRDHGYDDEKVIFIPRAHNNLKDALRSILDSNVLSEDRVQYYLNKMGGGVTSASEEELKDIIVANLRICAKYTDPQGLLDLINYKKLIKYLENPIVEEKILRKENGSIDRIYGSLIKSEKILGDPFEDSLFILTPAETKMFMTEKIDRDVFNFIRDLSKDSQLRNKVIKYLSALETVVIERTSSISGADVYSIFEEIRKELKSENKKLTLFIEDINVYKGIDTALVEVLIQEHDDLNGLCRLRSVVGSTDRYFDDYFNGAINQRMTRKIAILEKGLLEDTTKLVEFAARYINAIHFTKDEIEKWYREGADFPVWNNSYTFSNVNISNQVFSIFPFNENAIINLFECLGKDMRSPREFLKNVIKPGVLLWLEYGPHMIDKRGYYTENEGIARINGFLEETDKIRFDNKKYADAERREILFLIWGDRTFKLSSDGTIITCIPNEIFDVFEVNNDENSITDGSLKVDLNIGESEKKVEPIAVTSTKDLEYERSLKFIQDWQDGTDNTLNSERDVRTYLKDFVMKNIDWDNEGIPYQFAKSYADKTQNYIIEGSESDGKSRIKVERTALGAGMIRALIEQKKNQTVAWAFGENGMTVQIIAKTWLLKNKNDILKMTSTALFGGEDVKQWAVEAKICDLIARGRIEEWSIESIYEALFRSHEHTSVLLKHKQGYKWEGLSNYFEKNQENIRIIFDTFFVNTIGITQPNSEKVDYRIYDSVELMNRIAVARENILTKYRKNTIKSVDDRIVDLSRAVLYFTDHIDECIKDDVEFAGSNLKKLQIWLGDSTNELMIKKIIDEMNDYLAEMSKSFHFSPRMLEQINEPEANKDVDDIFKKLMAIENEKEKFQLSIICGSLNNVKIKSIVSCFEEFEHYLEERTAIFSSKIDDSLNKKITDVETEILSIIDNCLDV